MRVSVPAVAPILFGQATQVTAQCLTCFGEVAALWRSVHQRTLSERFN